MKTKTVSAAVFVSIVAGSIASADTLEVPGEFATIQAAINAALNGDTVLVGPGTYAERINLLGKAIEVTSSDGAGVTTIDGSVAPGAVVTLASGEGPQTLVSGFTITGGSGSGVVLSGASPVLRNLVITGNGGSATNGGGVAIFGGAPTLRDLVIDGNDANQFGGGLYAAHATLDAQGLTITNNGTVRPGGFNSFIYETIGGGGIYTTDTGGRIASSIIRGNAGAFGGGAYIAGTRTLTFVNTLIADNRTGTGAFYANASSPRLINTTIAGNDTFAVFTTFNAAPDISNSILAGNGYGTDFGSEIGGNGQVSIRYSVLQSGVFANTDVGDGVVNGPALLDAEFRPRPGSAAIDAGDNSAVPVDITTDLEGAPRFADDPDTADTGIGSGAIVDIGAFEFVPEIACAGDMNGDGTLDLADVTMFVLGFQLRMPESDLNRDGVHDLADVQAFVQIMTGGCGDA